MANPAHYFGFKPIRHGAGGTEIRMTEYSIASGLAQDLFSGDPVAASSGNITIGSPGSAIVGIFAGVKYTAADGSVTYKPNWVSGTTTLGSQVAKALVYDDPHTIFLVRTSGTIAVSNQMAQSAFAIGTGNSTTGQSGANIGATGGGTDVRVIKVCLDQPQPQFNSTTNEIDGHGLSVAGQYALCEVQLTNHLYEG